MDLSKEKDMARRLTWQGLVADAAKAVGSAKELEKVTGLSYSTLRRYALDGDSMPPIIKIGLRAIVEGRWE